LGHNFPENILIQIHVIVNDLVAHTDDLAPWNFGVGCLSLGGNVSGRFSKNLYQMGESQA